MANILLVLSALDPHYLTPHRAAGLAVLLKSRGARRVDLTSNSHFAATGAHAAYAVPAFTHAAANISQMMTTVIGASRTYDLGRAMDMARVPDVGSLLGVARVCLVHTGERHPLGRDIRDVAMVLYASLHMGGYDSLVFPHLSHAAQQALYAVGHNIRGLDIPDYGRPVLLDNMRWKIMDAAKVAQPRPGQHLN